MKGIRKGGRRCEAIRSQARERQRFFSRSETRKIGQVHGAKLCQFRKLFSAIAFPDLLEIRQRRLASALTARAHTRPFREQFIRQCRITASANNRRSLSRKPQSDESDDFRVSPRSACLPSSTRLEARAFSSLAAEENRRGRSSSHAWDSSFLLLVGAAERDPALSGLAGRRRSLIAPSLLWRFCALLPRRVPNGESAR